MKHLRRAADTAAGLIQRWVSSIALHRCVWCGESIPPGETYLVRTYKRDDGRFLRDRLHNECSVALATHPDQDELKETGFLAHTYKRGLYEKREEP